MAQNCNKCKKIVKDRQFLICSECKNLFHLDCTTVSWTRFSMMSTDRKKSWRCESCWAKKQAQSTPVSNITKRKKPAENVSKITERKMPVINVSTENSFASLSTSDENEDSSNEDSVLTSQLNRSFRLPKPVDSVVIAELLEKVSGLESQLGAANNEIQTLLSENYLLKEEIQSFKMKVDFLSKICKQTPSKDNHKRKRTGRTLNKTAITSNMLSPNNSIMQYQSCDREIHDNVEYQQYTNRHKGHSTEKVKHNKPSEVSSKSSNTGRQQCKENRKICIISNDKRKKITQHARNTLEYSDVCHYAMPGGRIEDLLQNIEKKLDLFTLNDYCIVFLGELDFFTTKNYHYLIDYIRKQIEKVQHTNVILCLPLFKYGSYCDLYNARVDIFNNILYKNNKIYEYAFIFDSNRSIEYSMGSKTRGYLKDNGMNLIFSDLNSNIIDIDSYYEFTEFPNETKNKMNSQNKSICSIANNSVKNDQQKSQSLTQRKISDYFFKTQQLDLFRA